MPIKFLVLEWGVVVFWKEGGGWKCQFDFYGRGDVSDHCKFYSKLFLLSEPVLEQQYKGTAKAGVKNRNKGECKHLFAFVHVCLRLLAFFCVFASTFACVCSRLCAFVCVCSHLLPPPFVAPASA